VSSPAHPRPPPHFPAARAVKLFDLKIRRIRGAWSG